jgi:hypothetical protein
MRCVPQLTRADGDVSFCPSSQTWPAFAGMSRRTVPVLLPSGVVAVAPASGAGDAVVGAGAGEDA